MKITSSDIKLGLKKAFPSPGWQVFYEVGNDTGTRVSRHADAVAMGIWPSNGHLIHGFEIKVSRGDFLSEMKDPTKSQAIFRFCNRWSLVTPTGLVKAEELPETWGLMTFDGKSMRTVKKAPPLTPEPLTAGFVAAMLRRAGEADEALLTAAVKAERDRCQKAQEDAVRKALERQKKDTLTRASDNLHKLEAYEAIFGKMSTWEIEQIKPYLEMVRTIGQKDGWHDFRNAVTRILSASEILKSAIQSIDNDDLL